MSEIKVIYFGHSCFMVEAEGYSVVLDPYEDGYVPGLKPIRVMANEVLCSHSHADHSFRAGVEIKKGGSSPFRVETILCPHDSKNGSQRGMNLIHILHLGRQKIVHLGDIGDMLPDKDVEKLRRADVLMIPVGGCYTIDAQAASKLANEIIPRFTIPMHYRTELSGFSVLSRVEDFTSLRENVQKTSYEFTVGGQASEHTIVMEQKNYGN